MATLTGTIYDSPRGDRGLFPQDLTPLVTNYHSMKMNIAIDQFSHLEKLATLTQLYLELRLPLADALRAAEADLWHADFKTV